MARYEVVWNVNADDVTGQELDMVQEALKLAVKDVCGVGIVTRTYMAESADDVEAWAEEQKLAAHEDQKLQDEMRGDA